MTNDKYRELIAFLGTKFETANIETRQVFGRNILKQPGYRDSPRRVHRTLEQTDRIMRGTFFVGVYPGLTEEWRFVTAPLLFRGGR